ncbi:hypothetical protein ScoT_28130 [Streptomyces albidoflavus]|uniref:Uncharacterized protein n=1 Tax=Streptomyces albidoflavus TaxID=1886 RepID=A0AA37FCY8_9ACTN|nr:hypothetical protein ScoT_28130 [Streptomyces albidoflavus]
MPRTVARSSRTHSCSVRAPQGSAARYASRSATAPQTTNSSPTPARTTASPTDNATRYPRPGAFSPDILPPVPATPTRPLAPVFGSSRSFCRVPPTNGGAVAGGPVNRKPVNRKAEFPFRPPAPGVPSRVRCPRPPPAATVEATGKPRGREAGEGK